MLPHTHADMCVCVCSRSLDLISFWRHDQTPPPPPPGTQKNRITLPPPPPSLFLGTLSPSTNTWSGGLIIKMCAVTGWWRLFICCSRGRNEEVGATIHFQAAEASISLFVWLFAGPEEITFNPGRVFWMIVSVTQREREKRDETFWVWFIFPSELPSFYPLQVIESPIQEPSQKSILNDKWGNTFQKKKIWFRHEPRESLSKALLIQILYLEIDLLWSTWTRSTSFWWEKNYFHSRVVVISKVINSFFFFYVHYLLPLAKKVSSW